MLEFQKVFVPIGGLDEGADPRLLPTGALQEATNAVFLKPGTASKRLGFEPINMLLPSGSALTGVKSIYSACGSLCAATSHFVYRYDQTLDRWFGIGRKAPGTLERRPVLHNEQSQVDAAAAAYADYSLDIACQERALDDTATPLISRTVTIKITRNSDGAQIYESPETIGSHCRAIVSGTKLVAFYLDLAGALTYQVFDTANIAAAPTIVTTTITPPTGKTYDATGYASGEVMLGYITAAGVATAAKLILGANTPYSTLTLTAGAPYTVSRAISVYYYNDRLYVATVDEDNASGAATQQAIHAWRVDSSPVHPAPMVIDWGPVLLRSTPIASPVLNDRFYDIGVSVTENIDGHAGGTVACCTWTLSHISGAQNFFLESASLTLTGGAHDVLSLPNLRPVSRAFAVDGRALVVARSLVGQTGGDQNMIFSTLCIMDIGVAADRSSRLASVALSGVFATGGGYQVPSDQLYRSLSSPTFDSTKWHFAVPVNINKFDRGTIEPHYVADHVEFDISSPVYAAIHNDTDAIVSGGFVGSQTTNALEETGYVHPPLMNFYAPGGPPASNLPAGSYYYTAIWRAFDDSGAIMRSLPPAGQSYTTGAPNLAVPLNVSKLAATNHVAEREMGAIVYKRDADGVIKRLSPIDRVIPNTFDGVPPVSVDLFSEWAGTAYDTGQFWDGVNQVLGEALYIEAGELENVTPNSARLAINHKGRIWLGGMYEPDRVYYSKQLESVQRRQPEFNDALSLRTPNGRRVTGLASLDDKVIVFTKSHIYAIAGSGPNDLGLQNDFSTLTQIASDSGCVSDRTVVSFSGGVLYQAERGIMVLGRGLSLRFVGESIKDTLAEYPTITSATNVPERNEIRINVSKVDGAGNVVSKTLVYNYYRDVWSSWLVGYNADPAAPAINTAHISSTLHNGRHFLLDQTGIIYRQRLATDANAYRDNNPAGSGETWIPLKTSSAWIQFSQPAGFSRLKRIMPVIRDEATFDFKVNVATDFKRQSYEGFTYAYANIASTTKDGQPLKYRMKQQKLTSVRVDTLDTEAAAGAGGNGKGYSLTGYTLEIGTKRGVVKLAKTLGN